MTSRLVMLGLAAALWATAAAQAQWFGPAWESNTQLTAEDRAMIRDTVQRRIHGKRVGTVATWTNPASGHSGTIRLLRKLRRHNLPCEQIEYRFASARAPARPSRYVFTSCRLPDGTWKLGD